ncbi:AraC family transcriptional regulator [Massilia sp. Se16.2.3]|uniref:AraC family transcriptional regulator n=1 Tax=Massilia sp. Se16.2.3 TaxID=2709303 RepID=UPI001603DAF1|nr:AraC family transcriptional regulator [Massilia sp. Se16.2.3]QNB00521.1 AraC family transcriptional regulator [Massilia sp. Se16.2.3]
MTTPCPIASPAAPAASTRRVTRAYLQPLLDTASARGVAAGELARACGLDPALLAPEVEELAAADYLALLDAGARLTNDQHFGLHVGERVRPGTYTVYGLVLLACRDLGQVLEQTLRYEALAHDLGRSRLAVDGGNARYEWVSSFPQASRHLAESVFAGIQTFGRWLTGGLLPPARIAFAHAPDAGTDPDEYLRVFGTLPAFGQEANAALFDAALLALPVPNADTGLYPVLREHAERKLAARAPDAPAIVGQVRAAIERRLAQGSVRLASIAQELGLSPRTLQRRLLEAGTSFGGVLDSVRYALARDYLRQRSLSLADIAFLLGYQEQSAFTHAFKEWSGVNPGAWRDRD